MLKLIQQLILINNVNVYSIHRYRSKSSLDLVYIVKAYDQFEALNFLNDHLKNVLTQDNSYLGFCFYEKPFEVSLFDSFDPEILEILTLSLYNKKY